MPRYQGFTEVVANFDFDKANDKELSNQDKEGIAQDFWTSHVQLYKSIYGEVEVEKSTPKYYAPLEGDTATKGIIENEKHKVKIRRIEQYLDPTACATHVYLTRMQQEVVQFTVKNKKHRTEFESLKAQFQRASVDKLAGESRDIFERMLQLAHESTKNKTRLQDLNKFGYHLMGSSKSTNPHSNDLEDERAIIDVPDDDPVTREFSITTSIIDKDNSFKQQLDKLGPFGAIAIYELNNRVKHIRYILNEFNIAARYDAPLIASVDFTPDPELFNINATTFFSNTAFVIAILASPVLAIVLAINWVACSLSNKPSWLSDPNKAAAENPKLATVLFILSPMVWPILAITAASNKINKTSVTLADAIDFSYFKKIDYFKQASNLGFIITCLTTPLGLVLLGDLLVRSAYKAYKFVTRDKTPDESSSLAYNLIHNREAALNSNLFWAALWFPVSLSFFPMVIDWVRSKVSGVKSIKERWLQHEYRQQSLEKYTKQLDREQEVLTWKQAQLLVKYKTALPKVRVAVEKDGVVQKDADGIPIYDDVSLFEEFQRNVKQEIERVKQQQAYKTFETDHGGMIDNAGALVYLCKVIQVTGREILAAKIHPGYSATENNPYAAITLDEVVQHVTNVMNTEDHPDKAMILKLFYDAVDSQLKHFNQEVTNPAVFFDLGQEYLQHIRQYAVKHNPVIISLLHNAASLYDAVIAVNNDPQTPEQHKLKLDDQGLPIIKYTDQGTIIVNGKAVENVNLKKALKAYKANAELLGKFHYFQQNCFDSSKTPHYFKLQFNSYIDPKIARGESTIQQELNNLTKAYNPHGGRDLSAEIDPDTYVRHANVHKFEGLWDKRRLQFIMSRRAINTTPKAAQAPFIAKYLKQCTNLMVELQKSTHFSGQAEKKKQEIMTCISSLLQLIGAYKTVLNFTDKSLLDSDVLRAQNEQTDALMFKLNRKLIELRSNSPALLDNNVLDNHINDILATTDDYIQSLKNVTQVVEQETRRYVDALKYIIATEPGVDVNRDKYLRALDVFQKLLEGKLSRKDLGQAKRNAKGKIIGYEVFDDFTQIFSEDVIKEFDQNIFYQENNISKHILSQVLTVYVDLFLTTSLPISRTMDEIREESEKIELFLDLLRMDLPGSSEHSKTRVTKKYEDRLSYADTLFTGIFGQEIGNERNSKIHTPEMRQDILDNYRYLFLEDRSLKRDPHRNEKVTAIDEIRRMHSDYARRYSDFSTKKALPDEYLELSFYLSGLTYSVESVSQRTIPGSEGKPGTVRKKEYTSPYSQIMIKKIDDLFGKGGKGELTANVKKAFALLRDETYSRYSKLLEQYGLPAKMYQSELWDADLAEIAKIDPQFAQNRAKFDYHWNLEQDPKFRGDKMIETYNYLQKSLIQYTQDPDISWSLNLQNMLHEYGNQRTIQLGLLKALATVLQLPPADYFKQENHRELQKFRNEKQQKLNDLLSYLREHDCLGEKCFTHPEVRNLAHQLLNNYIPHADMDFGLGLRTDSEAQKYGVYSNNYTAGEYANYKHQLKHSEFGLWHRVVDSMSVRAFDYRLGRWSATINMEDNAPKTNAIGAVAKNPAVNSLINYLKQDIKYTVRDTLNVTREHLVRPAINNNVDHFTGTRELPLPRGETSNIYSTRQLDVNRVIENLYKDKAHNSTAKPWRESIQELAKFAAEPEQIEYFAVGLQQILSENNDQLTENWLAAIKRLGIDQHLLDPAKNDWKTKFTEIMQQHLKSRYLNREPTGKFITAAYRSLVEKCTIANNHADENVQDLTFFNMLQISEQRGSSLTEEEYSHIYASIVADVAEQSSLASLTVGAKNNQGHQYFGLNNYELLLPNLKKGLKIYLDQKLEELSSTDSVTNSYVQDRDIEMILSKFGTWKIVGPEVEALYRKYKELKDAYDNEIAKTDTNIVTMFKIFEARNIEVPPQYTIPKDYKITESIPIKDDSAALHLAAKYHEVTTVIARTADSIDTSDIDGRVKARKAVVVRSAATRSRGRLERTLSYSVSKMLTTLKYNQEGILGIHNEESRKNVMLRKHESNGAELLTSIYLEVLNEDTVAAYRVFAESSLKLAHPHDYQNIIRGWAKKYLKNFFETPSYREALECYTAYLQKGAMGTAPFTLDPQASSSFKEELNSIVKKKAKEKAIRRLLVPYIEQWANNIANSIILGHIHKKPKPLSDKATASEKASYDKELEIYNKYQADHEALIEAAKNSVLKDGGGKRQHWFTPLANYYKKHPELWNERYKDKHEWHILSTHSVFDIEELMWTEFELEKGIRNNGSFFGPATYQQQAIAFYANIEYSKVTAAKPTKVSDNDPELVASVRQNNKVKIQFFKKLFEKALDKQKFLKSKDAQYATAYITHMKAYFDRIEINKDGSITLPHTPAQIIQLFDLDCEVGDISNLAQNLASAKSSVQQYLSEQASTVDILKSFKQHVIFADFLKKLRGKGMASLAQELSDQTHTLADLISKITEMTHIPERNELYSQLKKFCNTAPQLNRSDLFEKLDHYLRIIDTKTKYDAILATVKSSPEYRSFIEKLAREYPGELFNHVIIKQLQDSNDFYSFMKICFRENQCLPLLKQIEKYLGSYVQDTVAEYIDAKNFENLFKSQTASVVRNFEFYSKQTGLTAYVTELQQLRSVTLTNGLVEEFAKFKQSHAYKTKVATSTSLIISEKLENADLIAFLDMSQQHSDLLAMFKQSCSYVHQEFLTKALDVELASAKQRVLKHHQLLVHFKQSYDYKSSLEKITDLNLAESLDTTTDFYSFILLCMKHDECLGMLQRIAKLCGDETLLASILQKFIILRESESVYKQSKHEEIYDDLMQLLNFKPDTLLSDSVDSQAKAHFGEQDKVKFNYAYRDERFSKYLEKLKATDLAQQIQQQTKKIKEPRLIRKRSHDSTTSQSGFVTPLKGSRSSSVASLQNDGPFRSPSPAFSKDSPMRSPSPELFDFKGPKLDSKDSYIPRSLMEDPRFLMSALAPDGNQTIATHGVDEEGNIKLDYRLSHEDCDLITRELRKRHLDYTIAASSQQEYRKYGADEYSDVRENRQRVLLCAPTSITRIIDLEPFLADYVKTVTAAYPMPRNGYEANKNNLWGSEAQPRMPEKIFLRIENHGHWVRARISINYTANTVRIFYDNPFGNNLGTDDQQEFTRIILEQCQLLIRKQTKNPAAPVPVPIYWHNEVDQQGLGRNEVECGIYTLINDEYDLGAADIPSRPGKAFMATTSQEEEENDKIKCQYRQRYLDYFNKQNTRVIPKPGPASSPVLRVNTTRSASPVLSVSTSELSPGEKSRSPKTSMANLLSKSMPIITGADGMELTPKKHVSLKRAQRIESNKKEYLYSLNLISEKQILVYLQTKGIGDNHKDFQINTEGLELKHLRTKYPAIIAELWKRALALEPLAKRSDITPIDKRKIQILLFLDAINQIISHAYENNKLSIQGVFGVINHVMGEDLGNEGYLSIDKLSKELKGKITTDDTEHQLLREQSFVKTLQKSEITGIVSHILNIWINKEAYQKEQAEELSESPQFLGSSR